MYILRSFCYNFSDSCLSSHTSHGLKTFDVDELAITCNRFLCYYLSKQSREMCTMSIFRIWSFAFCMLAYVSIICTGITRLFGSQRLYFIKLKLYEGESCFLIQIIRMYSKNIWHILYTILLYIDENVLPEVFLDLKTINKLTYPSVRISRDQLQLLIIRLTRHKISSIHFMIKRNKFPPWFNFCYYEVKRGLLLPSLM